MTDIFSITTRPNPDLFYRRDDPNDPRLGEVVPQISYEEAQVVILGCPQDEGVRRNKGRIGAAAAPDAIRTYFYRLAVPDNFPRVFDLGNTVIQPTLEATHEVHCKVVRQVIRDGKTLVVLGGGNDVSYPDCSALAMEVPNLLAFNVDAHFDVRADVPRNSGTPYRQLLEENFVQHFYEMGYQPFGNSTIYLNYLKSKGVHFHTVEQIREVGLRTVFQNILQYHTAEAIFWGLDLDSVQVSDAPGVSAPNPTGFMADEFCQIARIAGGDKRSRIFEITEVNPTYDIDGRTCRLAAVAMFYFLIERGRSIE